MRNSILILIAIIIFGITPAQAYDTAPRISDREIVERLTTLEQGQQAIVREMDKRFDALEKSMSQQFESMNQQMNQRFESMNQQMNQQFESMDQQMNQRFESMDQRFESMDQRFAEVQSLIIGILVAFASLVAVTISFAIWDRRTAVKPVSTQVDKISVDLEKYKDKFETLLKIMRQQAKTDEGLAAAFHASTLFNV